MQLIGIILILLVIGFYFWWIIYTKNQKGVSAQDSGGIQVFNILVKGVYSPNVIRAKVGRPLRLNFLRQESTECSRFVNFPDLKIRKELPENQTITIEFTPDRIGAFTFTCDMSMYQGKLIIE